MIATDDEGCLHVAQFHELVERKARLVAFLVAEPADTCRQPLKGNALLRLRNPSSKRFVLGEEIQHGPVGSRDRLCGAATMVVQPCRFFGRKGITL